MLLKKLISVLIYYYYYFNVFSTKLTAMFDCTMIKKLIDVFIFKYYIYVTFSFDVVHNLLGLVVQKYGSNYFMHIYV